MDEIAQLIFNAQNFTDERTFLLNMSFPGRVLLWLAITTSFLAGWFTKVLIYAHIFKTKIKEQPINILIFIEQVIQHYCGNFVLLMLSLSLLLNWSVSEIIEVSSGGQVNGEIFCWVFYYTQAFNTVASTVDGLAIATVRLLYLLKGTWIRYKFGAIKFILWVGIVTVPFISTMTYLFCCENIATRSAFNVCMGHTQTYEVGH